MRPNGIGTYAPKPSRFETVKYREPSEKRTLAPPPAGAVSDAEAELDWANNGEAHSNNDDPSEPGRTGGEQSEREMKERFHSFVVPQIWKFGQIT